MPLDDFMRYFEVQIPQFETVQVTTLTGFFLEQQYDMKVGQPVRVEDFSFTPTDIENQYVNEFKVTHIKPKKQESENDGNEHSSDNDDEVNE